MRARLTAALALIIAALCVTLGVVRDAPRPGPTRYLVLHQHSVAERDTALDTALDGYHILASNYVDQPQPKVLFAAGWNAAVTFAKNAGVNTSVFPTVPPADEGSFRKSMQDLANVSEEHIPAIELARTSISGMARSLQDDHTVYIGPQTWKTVETGQSVTLGFYAIRDPRGLLVWETLPDQPFYRAGVKPGDLITAVDGKTSARPDPKAGVTAKYTLTRDGNTIEVPIQPDTSKLLTTHASMLDGDIAYLRIYSFFTQQTADSTREYMRELDKEIETLRAQHPTGWIIDMRNNPGGNELLAANLAVRFGMDGNFVENRERGDKTSYIPSQGKDITDGKPVAVLINDQSASAAEMVAAALQDSHAARVFGLKSPGLVNTSRYFPVAGGGLQITVARAYVGPKKRNLDKTGVTPDEIVALPGAGVSPWRDAQIDHAIDYLRAPAPLASIAR